MKSFLQQSQEGQELVRMKGLSFLNGQNNLFPNFKPPLMILRRGLKLYKSKPYSKDFIQI
jgi:hypothetical protein